MNITFRQLRVFTEVAQQGSMARAAATLHLTPPAVSMQIKEVEAQVGLALFERHGRQVSLSTAGEYFLVHARRLLANLKQAEDAMARFKRLEHGLLTIGIVSTAKYFVPQMLARFHEKDPRSAPAGFRLSAGTPAADYKSVCRAACRALEREITFSDLPRIEAGHCPWPRALLRAQHHQPTLSACSRPQRVHC